MLSRDDFDKVLEELGGVREFAINNLIWHVNGVVKHLYTIKDDGYVVLTDTYSINDAVFSSDHFIAKAVKMMATLD